MRHVYFLILAFATILNAVEVCNDDKLNIFCKKLLYNRENPDKGIWKMQCEKKYGIIEKYTDCDKYNLNKIRASIKDQVLGGKDHPRRGVEKHEKSESVYD